MPLRSTDLNCNTPLRSNSDYYERSHRGYSKILNNLLNLDRDYGINYDAETMAKMLMDSIIISDSLRSLRRLYGYADKTGNMVLPAKYEVALPFHNGCAYVLFREKWGVIDTKGNWIFAPVLEWPDELSFIRFDYGNDGRQYYQYGLNSSDVTSYNDDRIEGKRRSIYSFNDGIGCIYKYGHYGFIDTTGKIIASPVYDEVRSFVNGFAAVRHGYYWGYIDRTGKEVIPLRYKSAGSFTAEGLACVGASPQYSANREEVLENGYENDEEQFFGYIDKKGNWAIKPQFTSARNFSYGLASVKVDYEKAGYIDKTGKFVIPPKYNYAGDFEYGFASVRINMYEGVFIDKTGKISKTVSHAHPPQDKSIPLKPHMGTDNYYGYINEKGEEIIPYEFSQAGNFALVN